MFGTVCDEPSAGEESIIITTMSQMTMHLVVPGLGHAQPLFLTAIAVNRFTAFAFPLKHASMWRTRTVIVAIISLTVMSVLLGSVWPVAVAIRQAVMCLRAIKKQHWETKCYASS